MAKHTLCNEDELDIGELKQYKVEDKKILLYRLDDGFYATQHNCTHIFAPLARGKIVDGCQVQCPFHRARFDIRTGEVQGMGKLSSRRPVAECGNGARRRWRFILSP